MEKRRKTDEGIEGATSDEFLDEKGFSIGTEGEAHEEDDIGVVEGTEDIKLVGDDLHVFLRKSLVGKAFNSDFGLEVFSSKHNPVRPSSQLVVWVERDLVVVQLPLVPLCRPLSTPTQRQAVVGKMNTRST